MDCSTGSTYYRATYYRRTLPLQAALDGLKARVQRRGACRLHDIEHDIVLSIVLSIVHDIVRAACITQCIT